MDLAAIQARASRADTELRAVANVLDMPAPPELTEHWCAELQALVGRLAFNLGRDRAQIRLMQTKGQEA